MLPRSKPPRSYRQLYRMLSYTADRYFKAKTRRWQSRWYSWGGVVMRLLEEIDSDPNCNKDSTMSFLFEKYKGGGW